jgi:hypothetical protein
MLWNTPNSLRFIDKIYNDLLSAKNVLCILPKPLLSNSFLPEISNTLYVNYGLDLKELHCDPDNNHITDLFTLFKEYWDWDMENLDLSFLDSGEDDLNILYDSMAKDKRLKLVAITGLDDLSEDIRKNFANDITAWSNLTHQSQKILSTPAGIRFLLLVSPLFPTVRTDLFMSVHHFWGQINFIDHHWIFDRYLEETPISNLTEFWWYRALCKGLCCEDITLMEMILSHKPKNIDDVINLLQSHPLYDIGQQFQKGYNGSVSPTSLISIIKPPLPTRPLERQLWAEGLLSANSSINIHPVIMDRDYLTKTIALAQREVFLPLVDHVHYILCYIIEKLYGEGCWVNEKNEETREDVLSEISPLAFFIKHKLPGDDPQKLLMKELAFSWRFIRHKIAHNSIVIYADLEKAFGYYSAFVNKFNNKFS